MIKSTFSLHQTLPLLITPAHQKTVTPSSVTRSTLAPSCYTQTEVSTISITMQLHHNSSAKAIAIHHKKQYKRLARLKPSSTPTESRQN